MDENHEDKIRQRAFQLWEQDGQPEGKHEEHWQRALDEAGGAPAHELQQDPPEGDRATIQRELDRSADSGPEDGDR